MSLQHCPDVDCWDPGPFGPSLADLEVEPQDLDAEHDQAIEVLAELELERELERQHEGCRR